MEIRRSRVKAHASMSLFLSSQGVFIFFFHVVFNKEARKNLKNVMTGKKSIPDESSTTRASLLTVSEKTGMQLIYVMLCLTVFVTMFSVLSLYIFTIK